MATFRAPASCEPVASRRSRSARRRYPSESTRRVSKATSSWSPTLKNSDCESLVLSGNPKFLEVIERARAEFDSGKTLSLAEVKALVLPKQPRKKRRRGAASRRRVRAG